MMRNKKNKYGHEGRLSFCNGGKDKPSARSCYIGFSFMGIVSLLFSKINYYIVYVYSYLKV